MSRFPMTCHLSVCLMLLCLATTVSADVGNALSRIQNVGREGEGNESAAAAWQEIVAAGPAALLPILQVSGKGNVVADNWLRLAASTIADRAVAGKVRQPTEELVAFLNDQSRPSPARLLAFDLIQRSVPDRARALEASLIHDPAQELRRGAVQRLIDTGKAEAEAKKEPEAKRTFQAALDASRDEDQVKVLADALEKLGVEVDLPRHFGFITKWHVIGPFDNTGREGFAKVFPPEEEINLEKKYPGKDGEIAWLPYETKHEYGKLDFNKPLTMLKEATAYAVTTFESPEERPAELRLGCKNGWKVWVNGELLFGRDEYHRGQQMDQYIMKCTLKKGSNTILVKCCQNEQKETWTVEWEFQLRVCDATGTAILAANP
jgi:hypothetical protein